MKKLLPLILLFIIFLSSCSRHRYSQSSLFEERTRDHKVIAILPAQMIFTGKQPKDLTPEQIAAIEEKESVLFQESLHNGIMRYAITRNYELYIGIQDISSTMKALQDNNISVRDSWMYDDRKLAKLLGVDAVVRMRIQKQRYMSDAASAGIDVGRRIISAIGTGNKLPLPYVPNKTNEIYASCNVVSNAQTIWNHSYRRASDWDTPSDLVINNITDDFGQNFPYKRRR